MGDERGRMSRCVLADLLDDIVRRFVRHSRGKHRRNGRIRCR